jgi:hypothetical protein
MAVDTDWKKYAESAYNAYGRFTDFKNFQGNPMPKWEDLPERIQGAWVAAVQQVFKDLNVRPADE